MVIFEPSVMCQSKILEYLAQNNLIDKVNNYSLQTRWSALDLAGDDLDEIISDLMARYDIPSPSIDWSKFSVSNHPFALIGDFVQKTFYGKKKRPLLLSDLEAFIATGVL